MDRYAPIPLRLHLLVTARAFPETVRNVDAGICSSALLPAD